MDDDDDPADCQVIGAHVTTPRDRCIQEAQTVFPDICPGYLRRFVDTYHNDAAAVINRIVDECDTGREYPRKSKESPLKRKRSHDDVVGEQVANVRRKYDNLDRRRAPLSPGTTSTIRKMISSDFPQVPVRVVQNYLGANFSLLLPTYLAILDLVCTKTPGEHPWRPSIITPVQSLSFSPERLMRTIKGCADPAFKEVLEEFSAARNIRAIREKEEFEKAALRRIEEENMEIAKASGRLSDCECCFLEHPINRLVYCNGDIAHGFCTNCARRNVETQVGLSKYQVTCMSMDGCHAGFSTAERRKFIDEKLGAALDRIEQEAVIRMANLDNLVTCPFCPYAAECPSVEIDKEFRCMNPECEVTSCRLCNNVTHVPKSCDEAAREQGYSARRRIEEAMSAAMIRKCNKCSTPFIRENGCNKMTCTRQGCGNVQCYVCSKSCDYAHFNDRSRGGRTGNCPLFDSAERRHDDEVKRAEAKARNRVVEDNPGIDTDLLNFKMSQRVVGDDERRKKDDHHAFHGLGQAVFRPVQDQELHELRMFRERVLNRLPQDANNIMPAAPAHRPAPALLNANQMRDVRPEAQGQGENGLKNLADEARDRHRHNARIFQEARERLGAIPDQPVRDAKAAENHAAAPQNMAGRDVWRLQPDNGHGQHAALAPEPVQAPLAGQAPLAVQARPVSPVPDYLADHGFYQVWPPRAESPQIAQLHAAVSAAAAGHRQGQVQRVAHGRRAIAQALGQVEQSPERAEQVHSGPQAQHTPSRAQRQVQAGPSQAPRPSPPPSPPGFPLLEDLWENNRPWALMQDFTGRARQDGMQMRMDNASRGLQAYQPPVVPIQQPFQAGVEQWVPNINPVMTFNNPALMGLDLGGGRMRAMAGPFGFQFEEPRRGRPYGQP